MAPPGRTRQARTERGEPTDRTSTITTAAASTTAHIVAEPASDALTTLEEESKTRRKEVSASIIASLTSRLEWAHRNTDPQ